MSMGTPAGPLRIIRCALRVLGVWIRRPLRSPLPLPPSPDRKDLLGSIAALQAGPLQGDLLQAGVFPASGGKR